MLMRASVILSRQMLLKVNMISQKETTCRYIHLISQIKRTRSGSLLGLCRNFRVTGISLPRYASTNETPPQTNLYNEIPDPPTPIQEIIENIVKYHPNGEPTFASLGLGGYSPRGIVQSFLEYLHISCDIPWWTTIVISTLLLRILLFPLVIKAQKNMINLGNHLPEIQKLQLQMTDARRSGNHYESARATTELMQYMKEKEISAVKNMMIPFIQAPIFISVFLGLRGMANTPVESLREGGYWWMTDLTVHDPYYIMPIITTLTMYATIELGSDGTNIRSMGVMRYVLRALPFVLLPFIIHFPGAIVTYWASTNVVSLIQTGLLKIPRVRKALDMPVLKRQHDSQSLALNKKGFVDEVKQSWTNMKITKQLADRERADVIQFTTAGRNPIIKTFKYDPTKQKQAVLTKIYNSHLQQDPLQLRLGNYQHQHSLLLL